MTRKLLRLKNELFPARSVLDPTICTSCLLKLAGQTRTAATATAPLTPSATADGFAIPITNEPTLPPSAVLSSPYKLRAGILVSRPPILTRDLAPFEKAFYFYQKRLNERLALPFTRYFYYEKNTPADVAWKKKMRERNGTAGRDIGSYNAYRGEPWNDELLVGARESEPEEHVEALLRDARVEVEDQFAETGDGAAAPGGVTRVIEAERPSPRITEADQTGDTTSLNRALQRTLYLVVRKGKGDSWEFPADDLEGRENLHRAAERVLVQAGGINMNTWIVGNAPIGYFLRRQPALEIKPETKPGEVDDAKLGEKTFFMKARIMAGKFDLRSTKLGITAFRWLAKEELEKELDPDYWKAVRHMLVAL